jgi:hypothetical protein
MSIKTVRPVPTLVVVERDGLADRIRGLADRLRADLEILSFSSVLEVVGESGPATASGVICTVGAAGPFLKDLLRWTEPGDHRERVCAAVIGNDSDEDAINTIIGRDHVHWIGAKNTDKGMETWLSEAMEVHDLRLFRNQHEDMARVLRDARSKLFLGEIRSFVPSEGPPCGPPLPTHVEEIQALRDARAQYERGLIRSAIREFGSLKDASAALGISYTSLWRRLR